MTLAAAAIAGICLGGVVSLGIAVAVYLRRERRKREAREARASSAGEARSIGLDLSSPVPLPEWPSARGADPQIILHHVAADSPEAAMVREGTRLMHSMRGATVYAGPPGLSPMEVLALVDRVRPEPMGPPVPPRLRPPEAHAPAELHPVGWRRPRHSEVAP